MKVVAVAHRAGTSCKPASCPWVPAALLLSCVLLSATTSVRNACMADDADKSTLLFFSSGTHICPDPCALPSLPPFPSYRQGSRGSLACAPQGSSAAPGSLLQRPALQPTPGTCHTPRRLLQHRSRPCNRRAGPLRPAAAVDVPPQCLSTPGRGLAPWTGAQRRWGRVWFCRRVWCWG